jgi:GWxTD domain-containing protein
LNWILLSIISLIPVLAQDENTWEERRTAGQKQEEAFDYYKKWVEEDVFYIITDDEEDTFLKLTTDEEKDAFIEQFWFRRDPDKSTSINEFREEHYRRIAFANENFHSGMDGWRTDRGMVYIKFGKPTGIEKHPEGGSYARKPHEGGGVTSTFPFEIWYYDHIEGIGDGIEIEFVDRSRTNEYRFAWDSDDKDAHLYVPGAGETLAERLGLQTRRNRLRLRGIGNQDGTPLSPDAAVRPMRLQDMPFQRLERLYQLNQSPVIEYKDLERVVRTRISYDQLPLIFRSDHFQVSNNVSLIPVTVFVRNQDMTFQPLEANYEVERARLVVYGRLENLTGRTIYAFEDIIETDLKAAEKEENLTGYAVFQKRLPFQQAGRYKLSLVARDDNSGKMATLEQLIVAPQHPEGNLSISSHILTSKPEPIPELESLGDPFVLGSYRVVPLIDNKFSITESQTYTYFEVYNFQLDQTELEPVIRVEISLKRGEEEVFPFTQITEGFDIDGRTLVVHKRIPFNGLSPASYTLIFQITDQIAGQTITKLVPFIIED